MEVQWNLDSRADGAMVPPLFLQPLVENTIRGPNWSWLMHRDGESNPLLRSFCLWLQAELGPAAGQ